MPRRSSSRRRRGFWIRDTPLIRGVINRVGGRFIPDDAIVEGLNVDLDDPSEPRKRDGYGEITASQTGLSSTSTLPACLAYLNTGDASRLLVLASDRIYHRPNVTSTGGWSEALVTTDISGAVSRSLTVASDRIRMFQGNDLLWCLLGAGQNIHVLRINGTLVDCGGANTSPPRGAVDGAELLQRVWLLSGAQVFYSKVLPTDTDLADQEAFDQTLDRISLSPGVGGSPVALVPWQDTSLIAFFKNHIQEIVVNSANPALSAVNILETRFGAGCRDAIVPVGNELYYLSECGAFRALRTTEFGKQQGVIPEPVSEPIAAEIPGRLNMSAIGTCWAEILDDKIYLAYPRDTASQPSHWMVYDVPGKFWTGPWEFDRGLSCMTVADFGGTYRLYAADSGTSPKRTKVYEMFDGSYSDNGVKITYRETGKAHTADRPEADKMPQFFDMEFGGDVGSKATLYLRTNENDSWTKVGSKEVADTVVSSYPILDTDFPLQSGDYPLIGSVPKTNNSDKGTVTVDIGSDLPLDERNLPLYERDLPIEDPQGLNRGRMVQYRIENSDDAKQFRRIGVRIHSLLDGVYEDVEP